MTCVVSHLNDTQDTQQDTPLSVAFDRMCDVLAEAYRRSEEKRDK